MSIEELDSLIKKWLYEIKEYLAANKDKVLEVEQKTADNDLVTEMDKFIEERLVSNIREHFPEDKIVGEEGFGDEISSLEGRVWIIDPIDGTLNFVKQQENFAVMLALYDDGIGQLAYVFDVTDNKLYSAIKDKGVSCNGKQLKKPQDLTLSEGLIASSSALMIKNNTSGLKAIAESSLGVRMLGSAGLETLEVVKGNVVAYLASNLKPWDIAPGIVFMKELGLTATDFNGNSLDLLSNNNLLLSTNKAHGEIVDLLKEI
ncbi:MAG: inositol monophosphatase family protein [Alkalibacterium sp.]|nr:inositol monophosphatase family protein [Alkalibacterium sp.]